MFPAPLGDDHGVTFIYAAHSSNSSSAGQGLGILDELVDLGRDRDADQFDGPSVVGSSWQLQSRVFVGPSGIIYVVNGANTDTPGSLQRFVHLEVTTGGGLFQDATGSGPLATGFDRFTQVFGGRDNVIYAVEPDGTLLWFNDPGGNSSSLEGGQAIGSGFERASRVFASELNGIYSIEDAQLFQCFHDGFADGTPGLSAKKLISSEVSALVDTQSGIVNKAFGWGQFRTVFTPSPMPDVTTQKGGYIYMVTGDGLMLRFKHTGFQTGEPESGLAMALRTPSALHESWSTLLHLVAARM